MTSWVISSEDRDETGAIKLASSTSEATPAAPTTTAAASERIAAFLPASPDKAAAQSTPARPRSALLGVVLLGVALLVVLLLALQALGTPQAVIPTPLPHATAVPSVLPTSSPAPEGVVLTAALVGYFDPDDSSTATALAPGQHVVPIARLGHDWLQLRLADGAQVWVRWGELPTNENAPESLPDRAPTTPPAPSAPPTTFEQPVTQPPVPVACDEATAAYRIKRQVLDARGWPVGEVSAWSCVSVAEAETNAAAQEAALRATVQVGAR